MHEFYVLNLSGYKEFSNVLNEVAQTLKFTVINSLDIISEPAVVFIDINRISFKAEHNNLRFIAVCSSPEDLLTFFSNNIFHAVPFSISKQQLKPLFKNYLNLRNLNSLINTFNQGSSFAFDDFIFFADLIFMSSKRGIAFLSVDLNILILNTNFSTYFYHIFNEPLSIGKVITDNLTQENMVFWENITAQKDKFQGTELDLYGKWDGVMLYYKLEVNPVFREMNFVGYSVLIEDISEFTNANIDLVRYYRHVLVHNERLEKANKEIALNNEKLKVAYDKVNALSNRDYLTQAPNRKFFLEKIEYEQLRYKRTHNPFILVYGDIDDFKKVNDLHGHETGDFVLITLTALIKDAIRNIDFFCRWGGEEFLIFLAESDIINGLVIAERILAEIRNHTFYYQGKTLNVTMTFGIAIYKEDQHINKIIDLADKRLYWGKQNGKDQVVYTIPDKDKA